MKQIIAASTLALASLCAAAAAPGASFPPGSTECQQRNDGSCFTRLAPTSDMIRDIPGGKLLRIDGRSLARIDRRGAVAVLARVHTIGKDGQVERVSTFSVGGCLDGARRELLIDTDGQQGGPSSQQWSANGARVMDAAATAICSVALKDEVARSWVETPGRQSAQADEEFGVRGRYIEIPTSKSSR